MILSCHSQPKQTQRHVSEAKEITVRVSERELMFVEDD